MKRATEFGGRGFGVLLGQIAACWFAAAMLAEAQVACEVYTVKAGETLGEIASAAGIPGGAQLLFSANSQVLTSPNLIVEGMLLSIPCADGSLPLRAAPIIETATPEVTAEAEGLPPIRFLTGGNFEPFTDESLPTRGMISELVSQALVASGQELNHSIIFINDWDSHLSTLLPVGAFDLGFPWHLPDCTKLDGLSPENALRCTDFTASDPFFEAFVAFYAMEGGRYDGATSMQQLAGARLCRPEGWFTADLDAAAEAVPDLQVTIARIPTACWRELQAGKVDIVSYDALTAEADMRRLGLGDQVTELSGLATLATLHVLAPKNSANGQTYLDILNQGLAEIRRNGQWFEIVSRHLSDHNARGIAGN